jgi:hypothetical protein
MKNIITRVSRYQNRCDSFVEKGKCAIHDLDVHCMTHHTNLIVQILSKMGIVRKIDDVLQSFYACFSHSPKKTQKFVDLVNIVEIGG